MDIIEIQKITQGLLDGQISVTKADRLIEAEFKRRVNAITDKDIDNWFKTNPIRWIDIEDRDNTLKRVGAKRFKQEILKK